MSTLYQDMQGKAFQISALQELEKLDYDLVYINYQEFFNQTLEIDILQNYLESYR